MLGEKDAASNIAVKNLETAKKFYEDTLGLTPIGAERLSVAVRRNQPGHSCDMGRRREYERCLQALKAKGVTFEH